jgi:phosphopantothenoylcysteine decarboxylase/phosphopantothenate--cysteine ligase
MTQEHLVSPPHATGPLAGRVIVLGVTGSIAAYKAAGLASTLTQMGAEVHVILTEAATRFVTPLTFQALTHRPVHTDLWAPDPATGVPHIELAERAEVLVVVPATAATIARLAQGLAEDFLTCVALATQAPLVVAPAMDGGMFEHPATQANLAVLRSRGALVVEPEVGHLASGLTGRGRLAAEERIIAAIRQVLGRRGPLAGVRVVVTAGGTREPIDPVRFIGNRSSGKMGYALAEAARDRGAEVTLITGPTALPAPEGVHVVQVERAREMQRAVIEACANADVLLMAAAVADYRPAEEAPQKIKKTGQELIIRLVENPDILKELPHGRLKVKAGFAAESEDLLANAARKLEAKDLDLIVANDITAPDSGFGTDTNTVTLLFRDGRQVPLPNLPKREVAERILDAVQELLQG